MRRCSNHLHIGVLNIWDKAGFISYHVELIADISARYRMWLTAHWHPSCFFSLVCWACTSGTVWEKQKRKCTSMTRAGFNTHPEHPHWHAVAYCEPAPPYRQPSGKVGKNGGMQGEEHLVSSALSDRKYDRCDIYTQPGHGRMLLFL